MPQSGYFQNCNNHFTYIHKHLERGAIFMPEISCAVTHCPEHGVKLLKNHERNEENEKRRSYFTRTVR